MTDPEAEVALLRRQLARERTRRLEAESIGDRATTDLFETVRELRAVHAEIMDRAQRASVVSELARELRQELDPVALARQASRTVGEATLVDRCQVVLVADGVTSVAGDWCAPGARLPTTRHVEQLSPGFLALIRAHDDTGLDIADLADDARIPAAEGEAVQRALGTRALSLSPMRVGQHLVGWLVLSSVEPRIWKERELDISRSLAVDLGRSLMQVQVYEQQRESVRRLQEIDLVRDAFVSNVSHELRTPLTSISGYLELVTEGALGPLAGPLERVIEVISRNTDRLRGLVEDLLTLSAYDAASVQLDSSLVDLGQVVVDCHRTMLPILSKRDVAVEIEVAARLPAVAGDRAQLDRMMLNLVGNAVKFTPDGGRVRITLGAVEDRLLLQIADTGIGIPVEEQDRLFERFFRSSLSIAAESQGTGLGLALARTIIDLHGGTIGVASARGEGTTITVDLPAAPARAGVVRP